MRRRHVDVTVHETDGVKGASSMGGGAAAARTATVAPTEFLEVGGIRLRVSVAGRGRPLLLLNGIGAAFELLEPFRQR